MTTDSNTGLWTLFWEIVMGLFIALAVWGFYYHVISDYETIEDVQKKRVLVQCDDRTTKWFDIQCTSGSEPENKEPVKCEKCKPCKCEPCKFGKFDAEYLMQIKRCSGDSKLFDKFWDNCTGWEMSTEMLCEPGPNLEFCTDRSKERYEWIMQDRKWLEKEYGE
jgi:hypothetical protein